LWKLWKKVIEAHVNHRCIVVEQQSLFARAAAIALYALALSLSTGISVRACVALRLPLEELVQSVHNAAETQLASSLAKRCNGYRSWPYYRLE
jgi:hypothetical protein